MSIPKSAQLNLKQTIRFILNLASNFILLVFGMLFVCIATFVLLSLKDSNNPNALFHAHPSDEELILNFTKHQDEFEQLAKMLIAEKEIGVIFPDTGRCQLPDQKLIQRTDSQSCAKYVDMFRTLGLDWAYTNLWARKGTLWFTVSNSGLSVSGSSKGYYYSADGTTHFGVLSENTDNAKGQIVFRRIEKNWYIFLER